jgi:hypothetical protein
MDSGADFTQKLVIAVAIILGVSIVFLIGYSLYTKAKRAEGELANKVALDNQTQKKTQAANISLTGESKNTSSFTYDGLVQKDKSTTTENTFEIVNESVPVEVPEEEIIPEEEPVPPDENDFQEEIAPKTEPVDEDRPLTEEEIRAIRELPIENSPAGNLQTALEEESDGQYKARY